MSLVTEEQLADKVRKNRIRQAIIVSFVLFAFIVVSVHSETQARRISSSNRHISTNAARISRNNDALAAQQKAVCLSGNIIIGKFNRLQDQLIDIELHNSGATASIRSRRVVAYRAARIKPLPVCAK